MNIPLGYLNLQVLGTTPGGRDWLIACGFQASSVGQTDVDNIADNMDIAAYVQNVLSGGWSVTGIRAIVGMSDPTAPVTYESSMGLPESGSGAAVPANTAVLVAKQTLRGGRKGRGRTYFPGISDGSVADNGTLTGDLASHPEWLEGFWEEITAYVTDGPWVPVLLHSDDTEPDEITAFVQASLVATQRRRLRG